MKRPFTGTHVVKILRCDSALIVDFRPYGGNVCASCRRSFSSRRNPKQPRTTPDPRLGDLGKLIEDKYAYIRNQYDTPKNTIVLAHGLMGFNELHLAGSLLPAIHYWRGIKEALSVKGINVITATVPPYGSIEARAKALAKYISTGAQGKDVNIIAHSMKRRGLDSRYMISRLKPKEFHVRSLTTIATPHRGSVIADLFVERLSRNVTRLHQLSAWFDPIQIDSLAFTQLTRKYMQKEFNPKTPDVDNVRYFSYGAMYQPSLFSIFRHFHRILENIEGPNDGLVSVASSKWGGDAGYKGTLVGVNHLDLINWTNRLDWLVGELTGNKKKFNAIAFYLDIADMLAKEGL